MSEEQGTIDSSTDDAATDLASDLAADDGGNGTRAREPRPGGSDGPLARLRRWSADHPWVVPSLIVGRDREGVGWITVVGDRSAGWPGCSHISGWCRESRSAVQRVLYKALRAVRNGRHALACSGGTRYRTRRHAACR